MFDYSLYGGGGGWWLRPDLITGGDNSASMVWTLIGALFGFWGFLFSLYAVFEVRLLSGRYFTKQRLPELASKSSSIVGKLKPDQDTTFHEFRSGGVSGEAAVLLRAIKELKMKNFSSVLSRSQKMHKKFDRMLSRGDRKDFLVNDCDEFWEFWTSMSELSDELKSYQKAGKARL